MTQQERSDRVRANIVEAISKAIAAIVARAFAENNGDPAILWPELGHLPRYPEYNHIGDAYADELMDLIEHKIERNGDVDWNCMNAIEPELNKDAVKAAARRVRYALSELEDTLR